MTDRTIHARSVAARSKIHAPGHLALLLLVAIAGCVAGDDPAGRVAVAIVATGSDGAVYALPAGSSLELGGGKFLDQFSLDGTATTVSFRVPAGRYDTVVLTSAAGYTTDWPLARTRPDGTVDTAHATLVGLGPVPIDVAAGTTADLTIGFQVVDGGRVTFSQGTIAVTVGVAESTSTNGTASIASDALDATSVFADPATMPPGLSAALPAAGSTGFTFTLGGSTAGAWAQVSSSEACAPITLDTVAATAASGPSGFTDLVQESAGQGNLCVLTDGTARIVAFRTGAGTTATFSPYCTAASGCQFITKLTVTLPAPAFDGQTVDLSLLEAASGSVPVSASTSFWTDPGASLTYSATYGGASASFAFTPQ